jgi:hypothetical protein
MEEEVEEDKVEDKVEEKVGRVLVETDCPIR